MMVFEGEFAARDTLRFIEEKGNIGLWSWDLKSDSMEWSWGLYRLLGLDKGQVVPSFARINAMIHPEDRLPPSELDRVLNNGLPISREFRIVQSNGRVRWTASRGEVLLDEVGRPRRAVGALFDVTVQQDAIVSTKSAEARFRALVEASGAIVWSSGVDGTGADPAWLALTGQKPEEAYDRGWLEAVVDDDRFAVAVQWAEASQFGKTFRAECRLMGPSGEARWYLLQAAPVRSSGVAAREWVWTCRDIDARKRNPLLYGEGASDEPPNLAGSQLRAARGLLNWSVRDLAEASAVSPSVIRRLEEANAAPFGRETSMGDLRDALEKHGVEFLFPSFGKPGVRLR